MEYDTFRMIPKEVQSAMGAGRVGDKCGIVMAHQFHRLDKILHEVMR